jgi:hypothetical protein
MALTPKDFSRAHDLRKNFVVLAVVLVVLFVVVLVVLRVVLFVVVRVVLRVVMKVGIRGALASRPAARRPPTKRPLREVFMLILILPSHARTLPPCTGVRTPPNRAYREMDVCPVQMPQPENDGIDTNPKLWRRMPVTVGSDLGWSAVIGKETYLAGYRSWYTF